MKILHLDSGREMRGGQWQVLHLHQALLAAGHESLLLAREDGPLLAMATDQALPCESLRPIRLPAQSAAFDLVHAHDARSHSLAALFSKSPLVVSRRVAFPIRTSAISRWKYGGANRYLSVSRYVAGILIEAGINSDRIDIVYDGVTVPTEAAQGDSILTPYTTDPAKGMALAEEASKLAGVPLIRSTNLDLDLPRARAMIYLSQSEGLGSGILLGMAHGVTVIASNTGGIPELIDHKVNGILVENDTNSVAHALRNLDPARCREMSRAARETVLSRFTLAHMVAATLASYQKALNV